MRYSKTEKAILVGIFGEPDLEVKMKMIVLELDNLVELTTDSCIESRHLPGVYLFSTENIKADSIDKDCNILVEMSATINNKVVKRYSKISFGGIMDDKTVTDLTEIKKSLVLLSESVDILLAEVA